MRADVRPPKPTSPSLNSKPKYYLGNPNNYVDVIESPIFFTRVKMVANFLTLIAISLDLISEESFASLTFLLLNYFSAISFASSLIKSR